MRIVKDDGIFRTRPDIAAYTPGYVPADRWDYGRMGVTLLSGTYLFANGWAAKVTVTDWPGTHAMEVVVFRPDVPRDAPRVIWRRARHGLASHVLTGIACWPRRQPGAGTDVQRRIWRPVPRELVAG